MSNPLTLVLLEDPATPDMFAVVQALRARHPELSAEVIERTSPAGTHQGPADTPLIRCGGQFVAVMSMPAPIPEDANLWSRAATAWPEGRTIAERHRGHLIVAVVGKSERLLPVARITTAVVGALIEVMPECCAVVWDTKVARSAEDWLDLSRWSFAPFPDYPFTLWIDIMPFRSSSGICVMTTGLSAFVGREIEFETDRLTLPAMLEEVSSIAIYLIEHGPVISDGDTIGPSETERFTVRHMTSTRFSGLPVLFVSAG